MSYRLTRKMHDLLERCETYMRVAADRVYDKDFTLSQEFDQMEREIRELLKEANS